jgi:hypothetical protein
VGGQTMEPLGDEEGVEIRNILENANLSHRHLSL